MKNPSYQSQDDLFIHRLTQLVLDNLKEEPFTVEELATEIGLSRSQLYRRLKRSTGQTISQYVRQIRLEKARELLESDVSSTSEIAYQVGFSSPAYFHKCFNEYFGLTPGKLKKEYREKDISEEPSLSEQVETKKARAETAVRKHFMTSKRSLSLGYRMRLFLIFGMSLTTIGLICFLSNDAALGSPTIAILPIDFLAEDTERGYLAGNLSEALKMELGKTGELRLISKASTTSITSRNLLLPEIAEELEVDAVIEGSILVAEDSLWVKLQLIATLPRERLLWAKAYLLKMDQVNPFEEEWLGEISREVRKRLLPLRD